MKRTLDEVQLCHLIWQTFKWATWYLLMKAWELQNGGGGTQYKRSYRDVPQTWVAKLASWYINDPLFYAKLIWMGGFFKMFPNLSHQNWLKFKKIWNHVTFVQIWPKIGPIGIWMTFSAKIGIWVHFHIPSDKSQQKLNLNTPFKLVWRHTCLNRIYYWRVLLSTKN